MTIRLIVAKLLIVIAMLVIFSHSKDARSEETPYGCYKSLRWGMSFEQVKQELQVKMIRGPAVRGEFVGNAEQKIGDDVYVLSCFFNKEGLYKISFVLKYMYSLANIDNEKTAKMMIASYETLYPALVKKFGLPETKVEIDKGSNISLTQNILSQKAGLKSIWKTSESFITLRVEVTKRDFTSGGMLVVGWAPILVYEKIAPSDSNAKDVDL